jgi:hypothetical protein
MILKMNGKTIKNTEKPRIASLANVVQFETTYITSVISSAEQTRAVIISKIIIINMGINLFYFYMLI